MKGRIMLDEEEFNELVDEIVRQGFDQETAAEYAMLIGDTPVLDEQGNVIVRRGGAVLARLKPLRFFGSD